MTFSDLVPRREFAGEDKTGFEPSRTKFRCSERFDHLMLRWTACFTLLLICQDRLQKSLVGCGTRPFRRGLKPCLLAFFCSS